MNGTMSYLLWENNNIPNSGAKKPEFSSVEGSKHKPFRYRSKMDQTILITIAAKKNLKLREWMEAEQEKKLARGDHSPGALPSYQVETEADRLKAGLKAQGVNIEVPDFLKSI